MILNKYFLEENTLYQHTTTHQTTHQHTPPCTHSHKLRTWWVCPGITCVSVSKCSMSDVRCRRIRNVADCQNIIESFLTAMMISSHRIHVALLGCNLGKYAALCHVDSLLYGNPSGRLAVKMDATFLSIEDRDIHRLDQYPILYSSVRKCHAVLC